MPVLVTGRYRPVASVPASAVTVPSLVNKGGGAWVQLKVAVALEVPGCAALWLSMRAACRGRRSVPFWIASPG